MATRPFLILLSVKKLLNTFLVYLLNSHISILDKFWGILYIFSCIEI